MRRFLMLSAFILAAGSAQACYPSQQNAKETVQHPAEQRAGGSVWIQERPLPGTVVPMPDMTSPIHGQHGGMLA